MDKSNIMCLHIGIAFYSFVLMEQKYREARRGSRYFALRRPVFSGYRPVEQTNRGTLSAEMFATGKDSAAKTGIYAQLGSFFGFFVEQTNREPQGSRCLLQKRLRRPVFSGSLT